MIKSVVVVAIAVSLGGCGSIVRGTSEPVAFVSDPPGASMVSTSKYACPMTPCSLQIDRSDEFDATFSKDGYQPQLVAVRTKLVGSGAAGLAGNVLAGGIIGIGVDAATGAALDHVPNPVFAKLIPLSAASKPARVRKVRVSREPTT